MGIIEMEDVTLSYGPNRILEHFSLEIVEGEFITVIGSSGCGKTTLMKLINGLLKPDSGTVRVRGEDITQTDQIELRRSIGYVIQEIGLFPHMTVEKNITYVPRLSGHVSKKQLKDKALTMAGTVGLDGEFLRRYPDELSGGQRQRVGIARALMADPEIILMDEPFGAVDEITRRMLQDEISGIFDKMKKTIVFITHDIGEALKLGTRVIVMDKGKIVQAGPSEEIKDHPATEFVKELLCD